MNVAVAAPHPAAIEAAREVATAGGNALDAALAAAGALAVAYPHQCSAGGDLVALVRVPGRPVRAVLSIGAAAAAVDIDALRAAGDRMPHDGPQTITVPGVVAGWAAVAALGARLPLRDLLAPAIRLAGGGVPVSPGLRRAIDYRIDAIRADPGLSALLLTGTDRLVQPALAGTLRGIATDWRSFYTGSRLIPALQAWGSPLTTEDFTAHQAEIVDPLTTVTGGVTWYAAPPPVQGPAFLAVVGSDDLRTDAQQARRVRDTQLGDPRTGPPGVGSGEEIKARGDTVAIAAVDGGGTAVTIIQSVFESFGSGLLDPATGIVLHNRGSAFSLDPAHPGRIAPGSRPPHTLCPALALTGGTVLALGCQGGRNQPWILAQVAREAVTSPDLRALLARPRWIFDGPDVVAEPGTPGFATVVTGGPHDDAGHIQVARLTGTTLAAAGDPRADGAGVVLQGSS